MSDSQTEMNERLKNKTVLMPAETYQRLITFLVGFPYNQVYQCLEDLKVNVSEVDTAELRNALQPVATWEQVPTDGSDESPVTIFTDPEKP